MQPTVADSVRWIVASTVAAVELAARVAAGALLALAGLVVFAAPAAAQTGAPAPALAIPINLRCTTCNDFIRCESGGAVTVFRLKEKTFWAQVATIYDYLAQLWRDKTTDERPLAVYREVGGVRRIEENAKWRAHIDATTATITLPHGRISQRDGAWSTVEGKPLGTCIALSRREGFALVRQYLGKPAAPASDRAP
ncbi:MAG: hypothetical protein NZM12_05455 [Steroidobacteraceae bacterium]|nr:hypothetical protein [Steroidobacteraceae bacterium]MDW8258891.1 hypothetical protein [Gammaproteobacteria bacterium]